MATNVQTISTMDVSSKLKRSNYNTTGGIGWVDGQGNYWTGHEELQYELRSNTDTKISYMEYNALSDDDKTLYDPYYEPSTMYDIPEYTTADPNNYYDSENYDLGDTRFVIDAMDIDWAPYYIIRSNTQHYLRTTRDLLENISGTSNGTVYQDKKDGKGQALYLLSKSTTGDADIIEKAAFSEYAYIYNYNTDNSETSAQTYLWSKRIATRHYDLGYEGIGFWGEHDGLIPVIPDYNTRPEEKANYGVAAPTEAPTDTPTSTPSEPLDLETVTISDNEILYTTTDNNPIYAAAGTITGSTLTLVSNNYDYTTGYFRMVFDGDIHEIGNYAFYNCKTLKTIKFPNSLQSIQNEAFGLCKNLERIIIPENVNNIDMLAFMGCFRLELISVESTNTTYDSRNNCNAIIETATNTILLAGNLTTVIPDTVEHIKTTDNVSYFPTWVYYNASEITHIQLSPLITDIPEDCFSCCQELSTVNSEIEGVANLDNIEFIGDNAFWGCDFETINFSNNLMYIGKCAFAFNHIKSLIIPESVEYIGCDHVYMDPHGILSHAPLYNPFVGCCYLSSINVDINNPYYISDNNTIIDSSSYYLITGCKTSVIPDYVTKLEANSFAFYYDHDDFRCIEATDALTHIEIPESVQCISELAFTFKSAYPNKYLTSITLQHSIAPELELNYTTNTKSTPYLYLQRINNATIYHYGESWNNSYTDNNKYWQDTFTQNENWNEVLLSSDTIASNQIIYTTTDNAALSISDYDALTNASFVVESYNNDTNEYSLIFDSEITQINSRAFYAQDTLKTMKLPESVLSIYDDAFYKCEELISCNLPNNLVTIGKYAFCNCKKLLEINIPDKVETISVSAFAFCESCTNLHIGSSVITIDQFAFGYLTSFTGELIIPSNVIYIKLGAFSYCNEYKLTFNETATDYPLEIGIAAFLGNDNIQEQLILPEKQTIICNGAFESSFKTAQNITIPKNCIIDNNNPFPGANINSITVNADNPYLTSKLNNKECNIIYTKNNVYTSSIKSVKNDDTINYELYIHTSSYYTANYIITVINNTDLHSFINDSNTNIVFCLGSCERLLSIHTFDEHNFIYNITFNNDSWNYSAIDDIKLNSNITFTHEINKCFTLCKSLNKITIYGYDEPSIATNAYKDFAENGVFSHYGESWTNWRAALPTWTEVILEDPANMDNKHYIRYATTDNSMISLSNIYDITGAEIEPIENLNIDYEWYAVFAYEIGSIGENVFKDNSYLSSVYTKEHITSIGNSAFENCTNLESVKINGLDNNDWENNVFEYDSAYYLTSIGDNAFKNIKSLKTDDTEFELSSYIETIGNYAFNNVNLRNFVFSKNNYSLISIGNHAFDTALITPSDSTINIPASVETIGIGAFYNLNPWPSTLKLYLNFATSGNLTTIGDAAFAFNKFTGNLIIPNSVITIGDLAFSTLRVFFKTNGEVDLYYVDFILIVSADALNTDTGIVDIDEAYEKTYGKFKDTKFNPYNAYTSGNAGVFYDDAPYWSDEPISFNGYLQLSNQLQKIGIGAFNGNESLTGNGLTIPNTVTSLGDYAFAALHNYTGTLTLPNTLTKIPNYCFAWCSFDGTLTIPAGVTQIGDRTPTLSAEKQDYLDILASFWLHDTGYSFYGNKFTSVVLPEGLIDISDKSFGHCTELTSLTLPSTVKTLGYYAFSGCTGLTGNLSISNNIEYIGRGVFSGTGYNGTLTITTNTKYTEIHNSTFDNVKFTGTLTIPNQITKICDWAFNRNNFSGTLTIPNNVEYLGRVFEYSPYITNIIFSTNSNLTTLEEYSFRYCTSLTSLDIPSNISTFENDVFYGCNNVTQITFNAYMLNIGKNVCNNCLLLNKIIYKDNEYTSRNAFITDVTSYGGVVDSSAFTNTSLLD